MSVDELYHEELLDHARRPHNCSAIEGCSCTASGKNPLCGDQVTLFIEKSDTQIERVTFQGKGCVISQASASILTDALAGKSVADARNMVTQTIEALKSGVTNAASFESLDDTVRPLAGVRAFPTRLKCALLAWKLAEDLLSGDAQSAS